MNENPIKITEYKKENHNDKNIIFLMPSKDGSTWQYVNYSKGYICPCQFKSRKEALEDFIKYSDKFYKVDFEELNV